MQIDLKHFHEPRKLIQMWLTFFFLFSFRFDALQRFLQFVIAQNEVQITGSQ